MQLRLLPRILTLIDARTHPVCRVARRPTRSISFAIWRPFSVCRGRRKRNRLLIAGSWRAASGDLYALFGCDLVGKASQRPVGSICDRLRQKRPGDPECGLSLQRRWSRSNARLQHINPTTHKLTAPKPNRILAHAKCLCDSTAGPAIER